MGTPRKSNMAAILGAVSALALAACGSGSGSGGGGVVTGSGGAAGSLCNPASANQGCFNGVKMACSPDTTSTLGGKWGLLGTCDSGATCTESADPADTSGAKTKKIVTCKVNGSGGGTDTQTGGGDTQMGGGDATIGVEDTMGGGDMAMGSDIGGGKDTAVPKDTGGGKDTVVPKDTGGGGNCGNGTCDQGESQNSCAEDCADQQACLEANCADELATCGGSPSCVALNTCLQKCTSAQDTACVNACVNANGQTAAQQFQALGTCADAAGCLGGGQASNCGDGTCGTGESYANCPKDCPKPNGHICDTNCMAAGKVGAGCYCDDQCGQYGDCCDAIGSAPTQANPQADCAGSTCAACNGG